MALTRGRYSSQLRLLSHHLRIPECGEDAADWGTVNRPRFCWSCGAAAPSADSCKACAASLEPPTTDQDDTTGFRFIFRAGLRSSSGLALAVHHDVASLLTPSGEIKQVAMPKLKRDASPLAGVRDPAYRLWMSVSSVGSLQELVLRQVAEMLSSLGRRRSFARTALERREPQGIAASGLSSTEQAWLSMWLANNTGNSGEVVEQLAVLPKEGYPDKLELIAAHWNVCGNPEHADLMRAHIEPFETVLAALLRVALDGDSAALALLREPGATKQLRGLAFEAPAAAALEAAVHASGPGADAGTIEAAARTGPSASLRHALTKGRWAQGTAVDSATILALPESIVDDLIDRRLVGSGLLESAEVEQLENSAYLRARLNPGALDGDELRELGHAEELARRAFMAGEDWSALLSPDHRATKRFELLSALRGGQADAGEELVPLLPDDLQRVASAVSRSLSTGEIDPDALADYSTWPVLAPLLPSGRELKKGGAAVHRLHEWRSLHAATEALFNWNWSLAAEAARDALRTADDEDVRDEALNLLACALHQQGNVEGAARALEEALEGLDSPDLIVNYGVVAAEMDPIAASNELARLALDAPSLELRLTAARRALALWGSHIPGEDEDESPPESLVIAMRALSVEPTGLDEHASIMKFLSWADDEWLADERHTRGSPYVDSPQHRYLVARAKGPKEGIDELGALARKTAGDPFVAQECEDLAETLIRLMLDNDAPALGAAVWGMAMTDASLPLTTRQQLLLQVLVAREFAASMVNDDDRDATIRRELFDRVVCAKELIPKLEDNDAPYGELIDDTVQAIAIACLQGWDSELDAIADAYNQVIDRIGSMYRHQINRLAVRQFTDPVLAAIDEIDRYVYAVRGHLKDPKLVGHLDDLRRHAADLKKHVLSLPR